MSNVVLVTGVSRFLGGRLAAALADDPTIDRVIGVDLAPPRPADSARLGRTEFVRADIRNPLIAKVLAQARVDTVVHAAILATTARGVRARAAMQEQNVTGTMQLLAACHKSESVHRVVVRSTTAVYGSSPRDPAVFTEEMHAVGHSADAYARDAVEVENFVRGFTRRRSDICVSVLRMANLIGPEVDSALTRYLRLPVVPTSLGFDPRVQLLHEHDAIEVLRRAAVADRPGVVNVAADGVITLAQAVRRAGRARLPAPAAALALVGGAVRITGVGDFSAERASFLNFGRVVDTHRLKTQFGYLPRYTTEQALAAFVAVHGKGPRPLGQLMRAAERTLTARRALPALEAGPAGG